MLHGNGVQDDYSRRSSLPPRRWQNPAASTDIPARALTVTRTGLAPSVARTHHDGDATGRAPRANQGCSRVRPRFGAAAGHRSSLFHRRPSGSRLVMPTRWECAPQLRRAPARGETCRWCLPAWEPEVAPTEHPGVGNLHQRSGFRGLRGDRLHQAPGTRRPVRTCAERRRCRASTAHTHRRTRRHHPLASWSSTPGPRVHRFD